MDDDVPAGVIDKFTSYTGLDPTTDPAAFTDAAATLAAQTGLSTFVCLASFGLILFLLPPTRFFAAWTRPIADRRPAVLVGVLVVVFAAVLVTPALSDYFGLTGPARPTFVTVLPALLLWFGTLWAVFRVRLLDRILGLDHLPADGPEPARRSDPPR
jgi:cation-transporting ATPase E